MRVRSLISLSGLRIQHCHELWCRSKTWLGSLLLWLWRRPAATAPMTPSLGTSICHGCGPQKQKKKKGRRKTPPNSTLFACKMASAPQPLFPLGTPFLAKTRGSVGVPASALSFLDFFSFFSFFFFPSL